MDVRICAIRLLSRSVLGRGSSNGTNVPVRSCSVHGIVRSPQCSVPLLCDLMHFMEHGSFVDAVH